MATKRGAVSLSDLMSRKKVRGWGWNGEARGRVEEHMGVVKKDAALRYLRGILSC